MTERRRIEALRAFGYTPREAAFIALAALHGGYFLGRQYAAFIGAKRGRPDHVLVRKAVALGHCASRRFPGGSRVHHLGSRPLFAALGDPDNRNRRPRPPVGVLRNLMRLDFAVEHPDLDFLVTEREKVAHFLALPGVAAAHLPGRIYRSRSSPSETTRYFVDKTPVFLRPGGAGGSGATGFCYVEAGASSVAGFETFMDQYRSLLARLPRSFLVYAANSDRRFPSARRAFDRFAASLGARRAGVGERLVEWFRLEEIYERERFDLLVREDLICLRHLRREFQDGDLRSLFPLWKSAGDRAVLDRLRDERQAAANPVVEFSTHLLRYRYGPLEIDE
jgi:hypothetical protein